MPSTSLVTSADVGQGLRSPPARLKVAILRARDPGALCKDEGMADRVIEELDEAESLGLISAGGIGRIAYLSRFGPAVLPVNYKWYDGAVVFRTARHSALDEDLQTGIAGGDYLVAFEIDSIDEPGRQGWSVLIQGPAHHIESEEARARAKEAGVEPWAPGDRELFLRIVPHRVTGRRIRPV